LDAGCAKPALGGKIHAVTAHSVFDSTDVSEHYCLGCGYNLRGLGGGRCPECGRVIDAREYDGLRAPWVDRQHIGLFAAYWRTAALVTFRPGEFARRFDWPRVRFHDSHVFRLWTVGWAAAALVLATAGFAWRIGVTPLGVVMLLAAMVPSAVAFFYGATELAGFFTGPRLPSDTSEELFRARMINDYASAALSWTPVPAVVFCAGVAAGKLVNGPADQILLTLAGALAAWVGVLWLTGVLVMFRKALALGTPGVVLAAVVFPLRFAGLALLTGLFVFAPLACGVGGLFSLR
jgi:hypothetical protein